MPLPRSRLPENLATLLSAGPFFIGQILCQQDSDGIALCHCEDLGVASLVLFVKPSDALELAKLDDSGTYRPLKSAPNLRHGWRLRVSDFAQAWEALDFFYPAALANWLARREDRLPVISLRETLNRQTGMYRVAGKLSDEEGVKMCTDFCASGCLKHVLWPVGAEHAAPFVEKTDASAAIPLLCPEACNLLVAEARRIVKSTP